MHHGLAELAGFFAAHAIWCVSDAEPFVPIHACELASGERRLDRLMVVDSGEAQRVGREHLQSNAHAADRAVLVYDAVVNNAGNRNDVIVVEAEDYLSKVTFTIVVPYRSPGPTDGFGVFPSYLFGQTGLSISRTAEVFEPFFDGVDSHEKGSEVWQSHLLTDAAYLR